MKKTTEQQWIDLCNAQGWNDESQILTLEGFVKRNPFLFEEFVKYAQECADEENESSATH